MERMELFLALRQARGGWSSAPLSLDKVGYPVLATLQMAEEEKPKMDRPPRRRGGRNQGSGDDAGARHRRLSIRTAMCVPFAAFRADSSDTRIS